MAEYYSRIAVAAYLGQADYAKALELSQQGLKLRQDIGNQPGQINDLSSLARLSWSIGQYEQALVFYQQMLTLSREVGDALGEALALEGFAVVYRLQKQYPQALEFYQQALDKVRKIGNVTGESRMLRAIGSVYERQGEPAKAIEPLQQALRIQQDVGIRPEEGLTLNELGLAYAGQGKTAEALTVLQQALAIHQEVNAPAAKAVTSANIGKVLAKQSQPELAIVFYKQSVNVTESIRQNLSGLTQEQQQSYAETIADIYRQLAALLLSQGRLLEAEQVLELLKVQEIREYTRSAFNPETQEIRFSPAEQEVLNQYTSLIAFGQKVANCETDSACSRSQLATLQAQRRALTLEYDVTVRQFEETIRARRAQGDKGIELDNLTSVGADIVKALPDTVLIYPVVLQDKLQILWITAGGIANSVEVAATEQQVNTAVQTFRQLMTTCEGRPCDSDQDIRAIQAVSQQLYRWLIPPQLEAELQKNQIHNLVFALDRTIRYVPMSALFDGKQYLIGLTQGRE